MSIKESIRKPFIGVPVLVTKGVRGYTSISEKLRCEVDEALRRFLNADWGNSSEEDNLENDRRLGVYGEIYANYETSVGEIIIIATAKADSSGYSDIDIALPSEY